MKQRTYVLIGLTLLLLAGLAWWVFSKKTLPKQISKAIETDLEKWADSTYSKSEINTLIANVPTSQIPATGQLSSAYLLPLVLDITSNDQTAFTVAANEPRKSLYLNGVRLNLNEYTLAPPVLSYHGFAPLKTYYTLTLA